MKQTDVIQFITALQRYYSDLSNYKNPSQRDDRLSALADTLGCSVEDISEPAGFSKIVENVKGNLNKLVSYNTEKTSSSSDSEPSDANDVKTVAEKPAVVEKTAKKSSVMKESDEPKTETRDLSASGETAPGILRASDKRTSEMGDDHNPAIEMTSKEENDSNGKNNEPLFDTNIFRSMI